MTVFKTYWKIVKKNIGIIILYTVMLLVFGTMNLKANKNILIVVDELTENMILATRNLNNVILLQADEINTLDVISADNMIITKNAVKKIEEVLV